MRIVERLHAALAERAASVKVETLTLGLGYTAVTTDDGGVGMSYTWYGEKSCCTFMRGWDSAEGGPASALLDRLLAGNGLERSVGMAAANALNHAAASSLPTDSGPAGALASELSIAAGMRVAMVGSFPPVVAALEKLGAAVDVIDAALGIGDEVAFRQRLRDQTDALVLTSTALLNDTADDLLRLAGPRVRAGFLGPTTPLVPSAFAHLPVDVLAGMVPGDVATVLRTIRHGGGTPELQRSSRKVFCVCPRGGTAAA